MSCNKKSNNCIDNRLSKFRMCVIENFPFIEQTFDSITTYQLLCKVVEYLNKVICQMNCVTEQTQYLTEQFNILKEYVDNYFKNLDVQEEINVKLEEMAESGQLTELVLVALKLGSVIVFENVAEMKSSSNLVNNSNTMTTGYYARNDGGRAFYRITDTIDGTPNDADIIRLNNGLYAILLLEQKTLNVLQFGAKNDGTINLVPAFNKCIDYIDTDDMTILIPPGRYLVLSALSVTKQCEIKGGGTLVLGGSNFNMINVTSDGVVIDGINFINPNSILPTIPVVVTPLGKAIYIRASNGTVKNCNIDNLIGGIQFGGNGWNDTKGLIYNNRITNLIGLDTGFINDGICTLGHQCTIDSNYISAKPESISRGCVIVDINARHCTVTNNICICNEVSKVGVHSEASPFTIISKNQIYSPKLQGMTVSSDSIVTDNYVETPVVETVGYSLDHAAISCYGSPKNLIITGNYIKCQLGKLYGIRTNGSSTNCVISNNVIIGETNMVDDAIYTHIMTDSIISNNTIGRDVTKNNGIRVAGARMSIIANKITGSNVGISVSTSDASIINDNSIIDASTTGIIINNIQYGTISNNSIIGQTLTSVNGITVNNVGSNKINYLNHNNINNVTNKYVLGAFSNMTLITDSDRTDFRDTGSGTRRTMTVYNGIVNVD